MSEITTANLTVKLRGIEAEMLDEMVESGLHNTKAEAMRGALVNYGLQIGLLGKHEQWVRLKRRGRVAGP